MPSGVTLRNIAAPAAHAGLGPLLVVVRRDEEQLGQLAVGGHALAVATTASARAICSRVGSRPCTVQLGPAVELAGGQFDVVRLQLDAQLDDAVDLVDVVPVGDEVQHHRVAVRLHRAGHRQLLRKRLVRAGQQVVQLLRRWPGS